MVAAYREASYFEGGDGPGYSSYVAQESTLRRTFRRLLRDLERFGMTGTSGAPGAAAAAATGGSGGTGGRLLEVGCAYGFFLDEAKPYFSYRAGTEFSEAGAERARRIADRVYVGGLEEIPDGAHGGQFDTIVLIHTIEHVYDPVALLRGLMKHLAPGGWLVVATPDMGGFWRPLLGRLWPFWKSPEHVAFYSAKTLAALLVAAGCGEVRRVPYLSYFPLSLVREKIAPKRKAKAEREDGRTGRREFAVWMPFTTVAAAGRRTD
jgi:2-polyprenyl-3-methyl-5-hydroxy-6-metoxy-1,4-benzoquinol methylase